MTALKILVRKWSIHTQTHTHMHRFMRVCGLLFFTFPVLAPNESGSEKSRKG